MNKIETRDDHFRAWMKRVDLLIARMAHGMTSEDLPDYRYRANFDNGVSAERTAREAVKYAQNI
jgi:hypothetical protein